MTEEPNSDIFIKTLMTNSRLPMRHGFDELIMEQILLQEKRKQQTRTVICMILALSTLGIVIFLITNAFQAEMTGISAGLAASCNRIIQWISRNRFLVAPLLVLAIVQSLIGRRRTYA
jgi:uncharacterized membrane-anchored protein YitT (DUF2179 family)